ncbi:ribulose-bisphosphate carboxylase large subunit family protein [Aureimonas phyllosphaerae]|uniref:Ribulose-bisphosphate carboxylase large chain n=1 Tax=Aureimonas phyllosphaerae TaxID=1166078 RepID=A0A7W6C0X4_9HYPH|nr:ribulose-bisphosphate carboxylase large subunit family protein [Aureimonas phyllosphaerae]MBB3937376.1 ribulose-bisphosphate carboxylase large chain [Aureimonas phyllosphaerae]MBB3961383.1 ribulose-bisphosphate carboxylase large chain [Aureimonas phyllosphaerae]SFF42439.1 ribulose-bisphosphate carboxylase large chain [Aureimonas phyllosphaerae]
MSAETFEATYLVETPLPLETVAEIMAGEQSCGTFARVEGETDALRERARAIVVSVADIGEVAHPSAPSAWLRRRGETRASRRGRVVIRFPVANVGANLSTLAATVSGNLFDLGETTGLRLEDVRVPAAYRRRFPMPRHGVVGTRRLTGVANGAMIGSIIKPNVGLSAAETGELAARLCAAGLDFIKDDEISADPDHAPLAERIPAVMRAVRAHEDRTGKSVMVAFNITDETDAMRRHADLIAREGGTCAMVSLNWCGFSAVETLRRHTDLVLHGHRNGYGAFSRHKALGIGFRAYQTLWRLAGVDHMHVHGLSGKFAQEDDEVIDSARACLTPLAGDDDRVLPAFSSGQWAGTVAPTYAAAGTSDLLFMAGGGIMAHPGGPAEGVASIRAAWAAAENGIDLCEAARTDRVLTQALDFFGAR